MNLVRTIYFENRAFHFSDISPLSEDRVYKVAVGEMLSPAKLVEIIGNNNSLWIIASDVDAAFDSFYSQMEIVDAAGGVVRDGYGRTLMIYRRGVWDLPKGHVELGEDRTDAAIREVSEETGLVDVALGELVMVTEHFHCAYGRWEIKRTWWYAMRADSSQSLVPQVEEGITCVRWFQKDECRMALNESFETIRQVMMKFFESDRR